MLYNIIPGNNKITLPFEYKREVNTRSNLKWQKK